MPEITPMDVIGRGALVFNGLLRPATKIVALGVNVLSDLPAVLRLANLHDMRVIAHPSHAAPAKETILDRVLHGRPEIRVMLDFVVQRPLNQQARHPANRVMVRKAPRYACLWQPREHRRHQGLHVRPKHIKSRRFGARSPARADIIAVAPNDLGCAGFPLGKLAVVLPDNAKVFLKRRGNGQFSH